MLAAAIAETTVYGYGQVRVVAKRIDECISLNWSQQQHQLLLDHDAREQSALFYASLSRLISPFLSVMLLCCVMMIIFSCRRDFFMRSLLCRHILWITIWHPSLRSTGSSSSSFSWWRHTNSWWVPLVYSLLVWSDAVPLWSCLFRDNSKQQQQQQLIVSFIQLNSTSHQSGWCYMAIHHQLGYNWWAAAMNE